MIELINFDLQVLLDYNFNAARVAQLVEHSPEERGVGGSSPPPGIFLFI